LALAEREGLGEAEEVGEEATTTQMAAITCSYSINNNTTTAREEERERETDGDRAQKKDAGKVNITLSELRRPKRESV